MEAPQKTKSRTLIWSSNPTSEYIPKINKIGIPRYLHSMFIAVLFTIVKIQQQLKWPSTDKWIRKI